MRTRLGLGVENIRRAAASTWADAMLSSYRSLNPEQADWFDSDDDGAKVESELYARLADGLYLHQTFGPSGQDKIECDFVYAHKFIAPIYGRSPVKNFGSLRWDFDGIVTLADNHANYTTTGSPGVMTVSSEDGWDGLIRWNIHTNKYIGVMPRYNFPNMTHLYAYATEFAGPIPAMNATKMTYCYLQGCKFSSASLWLQELYKIWSTFVSNPVSYRIDTNPSLSLSGVYQEETPPITDLGLIFELENDPKATGNRVIPFQY